VGKAKAYIELNGSRYDAMTGTVVAPAPRPLGALGRYTTRPTKPHTQVVDGFLRRAGSSKPVPATHKAPTKTAVKRASVSAQSTHRKTQHTKTLMRHTVRKPSFKGWLRATSTPLEPADSTKSLNEVSPWASVVPERIKRAGAIHKSKLISKFGATGGLLIKTAALPVRVPLKKIHESQAAPAKGHHTHREQLLNSALAKATSHEQPKIKKARLHHRIARKLGLRPKVLNAAAVVVASLLLGGFFVYQNLPNLAVRMAAARAGFPASLPSYQPAGFSLKGPIEYAPGQLTLNFRSNSDKRNFQVKQQPSNWNSETLLDTYVAKSNEPYQTYQNNGKTIYIYNGSSATWVDAGVWYKVEGNSSLTSDQLIKIADSL
jgi:hypothetical protein